MNGIFPNYVGPTTQYRLDSLYPDFIFLERGELWQEVVDTQVPAWSEVVDSQVGGWVELPDSQTPVWGQGSGASLASLRIHWAEMQVDAVSGIPSGAETELWVNLDDAQTAGWVFANDAQVGGWGALVDSQAPDWGQALPFPGAVALRVFWAEMTLPYEAAPASGSEAALWNAADDTQPDGWANENDTHGAGWVVDDDSQTSGF